MIVRCDASWGPAAESRAAPWARHGSGRIMRAMRYDLRPLAGAGPLELGMSRDRVLETLDHAPRAVGPGLEPPVLPDAFHDGGLLVHYAGEKPPRVVFVEFVRGHGLEVAIFDRPVFETPADELIAFLTERTDYDRDDPELPLQFAFLDWELTLGRRPRPGEVLATDGEDDGEDDDLDAADDDPDAGRFFDRVGLGVRGYVSGENS